MQQSVGGQAIQSAKACLLKETEERIEILNDPNFDCLATNTAAGLLICSEPALAMADVELNGLVVGMIARLKDDETRDAFAEYARWTRARDRKCDLDDKDNVPLQELSASAGCLAEYISQKTAEMIAAKGDPKQVFGRHLSSPLPDADGVDLCVAQIHSANSCLDFLRVSRVFEIDREIAERSALVTAEVEMIVLSPFALCSPIASSCTGMCWDVKQGEAKPSWVTREGFAIARKLRIEKAFAFQKTDSGWRCNTPALQPVDQRSREEKMTRLPHVDSARRFFPNLKILLDAKPGFRRRARLAPAAVTIGFGLAVFCTSAFAQNAAKGTADHIKAVTSAVDSASIKANTATSKDWPTYGLDYAETRFSKLNQINTDNVKNLGLMWSYNLESIRGVEATPVVVDGIMYVTASWSVVHAVDARSGKRIWSFDPGVDREKGYKGCCDVVNRGVALYRGKIFVGAYDGRLIALDAVTGNKGWEKDTIIDHSHSYTVTGAPRVVKGKVLIGNGGAEFGVRGYVTAYDAETGAQ